MTRRHIALLLIGFIAGIASAKSHPMSTASVELPTTWHDFAEVPDDDREFANWWNDLGNRAWQEKLKHPRAKLWLACQLKVQPRADVGAAGGGKGVTLAVADPHSVQAEGREAAYLLWKKAADRPAEFSERSEAIGEFRDVIEHPGFRELVAQVKRERNP